jgi:hypothetical protein
VTRSTACTEERARGGPCSCCTLDWIWVAAGSMFVCCLSRGSWSRVRRSERRRWCSRAGGPGLGARRAGARSDRVDDRRAFCSDALERHGWDVLIADAQRVKRLAPLACETDRIDARVLAVLSERGLVPAIWLPDPAVRRERERARFRLRLVEHRSMLRHRIHSTLIAFGKPCPVRTCSGSPAASCSTGSRSRSPGGRPATRASR